MSNTILNDKQHPNLLINGGFTVAQKGTTLGGDVTSTTNSNTSVTSTTITNLRVGMTAVHTTAITTPRTIAAFVSATALTLSGNAATTGAVSVSYGCPDDTYGACDMWNLLTQTGGIKSERVAGATGANSPYAMKLTNNHNDNQRFGFNQILESTAAIQCRGSYVRAQGKLALSNGGKVRLALVEWTGTADSVTSDCVSDWTSTTYTNAASCFFSPTTTTVVAVSDAFTLDAATLTDVYVGGTVSTSCNNLMLVVWTELAQAVGVTLTAAEFGMYEGVEPRNFTLRPVGQETMLCKRYYEKIAPATTAPYTGGGLCTTTAIAKFVVPYVEKRAVPTLSFSNSLVADYSVLYAATTVAASSFGTVIPNVHNALIPVTIVGTVLTAGQSALLVDSGSATLSSIEVSSVL